MICRPLYEKDLCGKRAAIWFKKKTEFKKSNVKRIYNGTETLTFLRSRILK